MLQFVCHFLTVLVVKDGCFTATGSSASLSQLPNYDNMLVCLFWIRSRICPTGSTPKGGPTEITPATQATRQPRALSHFLFPLPPYFCHESCIRSILSPVFLSCT